MAIILHGNQTSPFARRIRMQLEGVDYTFQPVDILTDEGRAAFATITPIRKMPVLEDDGSRIFDSHVIYQHLQQRLQQPQLTLAQYNQISVIDAVSDSMVILLMSQRSELPVEEDRLIFKLQRERIEDSLHWLDQQAAAGQFDDWHYPTICLICMVDWTLFRALHSLTDYPNLLAAARRFDDRDICTSTRPQ
ncbi:MULTISPECIES: glutathione S-transferase family protein [unclassified Oceanobacter]|jgi:glutathione S-transferase|uniref:glutathione S-transferase family protein n=1 Tax=unclassified Oceanobacter TaxID=2620260 RepID=UPI0026E1C0B9|nr:MULTISPECIES: glutathione S-transferase family protein [unclassified Oceanobacter]MDO6683395.1 glutathione S-transferase family protein [Oceanobacter sp. 5_MG-2023]MDP2506869.1 glutathione S-transferase family protein [Oceanobacter sp. 3_MG-2023]MDP2547802.1 glutathione S-transferase family protein [Oceanobacter sp. 4_MG-2023]MDP2608422.1 glutathione S-transferase family protein [Oceanobacter sp. 1_MG-2023]MDP2611517.1 glutathione S-transferase family protein [Oceanobacter sp. 2_MG-2023]